jgi:putative hemolysin
MQDDERDYRSKIVEPIMTHVSYFDHVSWPKFGTDEWEDFVTAWVEAFGFRHVSPRRLERAMREIRRDPPQFKQDHLPRLLELVEQYKREERSTADVGRLAEDEHAGPCPYCEGNGYALIYRRDYKGEEVTYAVNPDGSRGRMIYLRICAPCICKRGRDAFASLVRGRTRCVDIAVMPRDWSFDEPDWTAAERSMA